MKGLFVLLVIAFASLVQSQTIPVGYARLYGGVNDRTIAGDVYFLPWNATHTWVYASISGITQNPNLTHPLHVHQYGDISTADFTSAGAHFVGDGSTSHGCETTDTRHEGDMGNWNVASGVFTNAPKKLDLIILVNASSVIGKAVVLHNITDDCSSATQTGNAGARLASGVIGIANLTNAPAAVIANLGTNTINSAVSGDTTITRAVAVLIPTSGNSVYGLVTFEVVSGNQVLVKANITGLTPGNAYGFHVHQYGDIHSTDGLSTGSHYNPYNSSHGIPPNSTRHAGDMGNICSFDAAGNAYYSYTFADLLTTNGSNNVIGRAVVVHAIRDNGGTNYGARLAFGVIGVANPTTNVTIPTGVTISAPLCASSGTTGGANATTHGTATSTTHHGLTTGSPASATLVGAATVLIALLVSLLI